VQPGPPEGGPGLVLGDECGNRERVGQDPPPCDPPVPGVDSAGRPPVRRLAALHLQSPVKHVNQLRTTSFLW